MAKKIYSYSEVHYAIKIMEEDPYLSEERFKNYLERYPNDYFGRTHYAMVLTRLCKFDEAEKEYDQISRGINSSNKFIVGSNFLFNMFIIKVKILIAKEKYEELYKFLIDNYKLMIKSNLKNVLCYCEMKLGKDNIPKGAYLLNQSYDYSEEAFLEHIKKHTSDYNEQIKNVNPAVFTADFPLDKVIAELKKIIPADQKFFEGYFDDCYYFRYDNCGRVNDSLTNFFKVVCLHNTANFITMYPTNNGKNMSLLDLNYLKDNEMPKVKILSQVEKFKRRYNFE